MSVRRMPSIARRNGAAQIGDDEDADDFESVKFANSKSEFVAGGLVVSLLNSVSGWIKAALAGVFFQRPLRVRDRLGANGMQWNRAYFRIFVFFVAGAFMGLTLTPFLWVDVPKNLSSESGQEIPLKEGSRAEGVIVDRGLQEEVGVDGNVELGKNSVGVRNESFEAELARQRLLIIVTPTYVRPFQAYHLNRLAHTLGNVRPPLLWIVVEMSKQSEETAKILRGSGVMFRHLVCDKNVTNVKDVGLYQRNVALSHIENHRLDGIVHFADDTGIYSFDLFHQMRKIRRFGTWPVAIVSGNVKQLMVEGPVCNGSRVIGWHSDQDEISRRFRVEMAGFAFNSTILWEPIRWYQDAAEPIVDGLEEIAYVEQLLEDESETECVTENNSSIMVWHFELEAPDLVYPKGWVMKKNLEVVASLT